MEMIQVSSDNSSGEFHEVSDSSKTIVCVNRNGKTPGSDTNIMCDILSRLPPKFLMRFKSVCTQWKSLIETDPYLINLHYRHHSREQRTLLFISSPPRPKHDETEAVGGTIDFTCVGPIEVQKLEIDRPSFGIPRQTVAGLVCVTAGGDSFLIYNPCTGQRTPWIETPTIGEHIGGENGRQVDCIAFGYSPRTKEHKVLCISSKKKKGVVRGLAVYIPSMPHTEDRKVYCMQKSEDGKELNLFDHAGDAEEVGADEEQVCQIFTVGENTWRRIDAVPPYSLLSKVCYVGGLSQYNEECKSVYVRGKIYWRFRYTRKGEVIMVFDVRTEKFKVISIPEHVTKTPWKYPQTVELLDVDGHIAVVKYTRDIPISLWILDQDNGSDKWSYEEVRTPCEWHGNLDLSIEAIVGSNLIILKDQMSDVTYFYDRADKKYEEFTVNERCGLNFKPGELREIVTVVYSITPVCTSCNMF
ncbi:hypothetical protein MKW92_005019 [Papaver armeniacum]|nr:hypothetical protein MKW92_005019 [Papaver armeniacum]